MLAVAVAHQLAVEESAVAVVQVLAELAETPLQEQAVMLLPLQEVQAAALVQQSTRQVILAYQAVMAQAVLLFLVIQTLSEMQQLQVRQQLPLRVETKFTLGQVRER
jgi:hypothetical protein